MSGAGPWPRDVVKCRACGVELVFVRTKAGRRIPVNVQPTAPPFRGPNAGEMTYVHGEHQTHFATCPEADRFRNEP